MTAQDLKNSILQLAVQGKLVPQCKEDEPASELLKRISAEKAKLGIKEKPLPEITDDEIPFDIPEKWKWIKLGKIVSVISGTSYKSSDVTKNGIRILRGGNIQTSQVQYDVNDVFLPKSFLDNEKTVKKGDVLIVASTGSKTVIGKPGFVTTTDNHTQIGAFLRIVRPCSDCLHDYLKMIFDSEFYRNHIRNEVQGMNINNIKTEHITDFVVPFPPLAEQKRIVAKIEELLPMVEEYGKAQEQLATLNAEFPDKLRKSILQQAVQGKLTERDPADEPASELLKRIKAEKETLIKSGKIKKEKPLPAITDDEKPFDIPDTWEWTTIAEVCTNIQYGTSEKSHSKGAVAVLRMGNIQNGKIDYSNLVYSSNEEAIEKYHLDYNDLVFNRTNSKELVGKTAIYKAEIPAIYAGYLVRITPVIIDSDYLNYVMQSKIFKDYCASVKTDAIGQSNINAEKMKRFLFPLPPLAEQKRIVKRVDELLALCEGLK